MNGWNAQAIERVSKPKRVPQTPPRPAPSATQATSGAQGAAEAKPALSVLPIPAAGAYPGPCTWVLAYGRATLSLPRPHDPARQRIVLACAPDEALIAALLATVEAHFATPNTESL